jgi:hypothetical protein
VLLLQFTYLLPAETIQKLAILEVKAQHFLESAQEPRNSYTLTGKLVASSRTFAH